MKGLTIALLILGIVSVSLASFTTHFTISDSPNGHNVRTEIDFTIQKLWMNNGTLGWTGFVFYGTMNSNIIPNVGDPGIYFTSFLNYDSSSPVNY